MKKFCILLSTLLLLPACSAGVTLEGGITYDADTARRSLMEKPSPKIERGLVRSHLTDAQNRENLTYVYQGRAELKDRVLAFFSDSTYAVMFNDNPLYVWYYSPDGTLLYVGKKDRTDYPYKTYKYTAAGRLVNMSLRVSKEESFIYLPSGKLIAHWLGANAYDEAGNIIMTRKYAE